MKLKALSVAVATALISSSALAVEFHGYARSNVATSDNGSMVTSNKTLVGRLGNENDTYAELALAQDVYDKDDITFTVNTLVAYGVGENKADWAGSEPALREMNAQAKGVFGAGTTLWAGKRFYQRHDIHITDDYYWAINGEGAGIEGINTGAGNVSVAWFEKGNSDSGTDMQILDLRWAGIDLWKNGSLELGFDYFMPNLTDAQDKAKAADNSSMMFTAELTQGGFMGGFNKFVVQAGNYGIANGFVYQTDGSWLGDYSDASDDAQAWRIYDWGVISPTKSMNLGYTISYVSGSDIYNNSNNVVTNDNDLTIINAVVRPQFIQSDTMKTVLELGYYSRELESGNTENIKESEMKATIAQVWSAGPGFWARPEIRVFATYLSDLEENSGADGKQGRYRGDESSAVNVGVQMEAWW